MTAWPDLRDRIRRPPRFSPYLLEHGKRLTRPRLINRTLLHVRVTGRELVPADGSLLIAGNHSAWLDGPLVVIEAPRPVRCLTKVEMFVGPLGHVLHLIGQIPVDRTRPDRGALAVAVGELHEGGAVGVFPEGTRGSGEFAAMHDGIAYLAVRGDCPIVPVACIGTSEVWPPGARLPRRATIDVVFGKPFQVELPTNRRSRKALSELSEQIRGHLVAHLAEARTTRAALEARGVRSGDVSADLKVAS
ncbi:MAG TPA: lysophospholipid acyltransferase family protein [Frankiaceae bacterium]|nr:lysophospholipid acyltransferase family protein [Frankiaceae bacterium]